jgi:hypothetical protein
MSVTSTARRPLALLLLAGGLLTGCGGDDRDPTATDPPVPVATSDAPTASDDPLGGSWTTSFTCRASVRAVERAASDRWHGWLPSEFGGRPTDEDPCRGATAARELEARFQDGVLALCEASSGVCDVHAAYELPSAGTIRIDDPEGNLCEPGRTCPIEWGYEVAGTTLTFDVGADPWTASTWAAASWTRKG